MVNGLSNRAAETPTPGGDTRNLLEKFFTAEVPTQAANNHLGDNVIPLARRREIKNSTELEGTWLQRHVGDWFLTRTETRSDLYAHGQEVANDNRVKEATETWTKEDELGEKLDVAEKRIEAVQAEAADNGENLSFEEAKDRVEQEVDRFTDEKNGRYTMKTRWEVMKDNWSTREKGFKGFFKFAKQTFVDFFKYGAIKKVVPGLNMINYAKEAGVELMNRHGEDAEALLDKAKEGKAALRDKKNIEKEGAQAVLMVKASLSEFRKQASLKGKQAFLDIVHSGHGKRKPKDYLLEQIDTTELKKIQKRFPHTFASMAEDYGVKARKLRGKAAAFELSTRIFDWYLAPSQRTRSSVWDEVKEVGYNFIPFSTAYDVLKDGASDLNHLPTWAKYSIIVGETGLDVASVFGYAASIFTGGTTAPLVAGAATAAKGTLRTGLRKLAGHGAEVAAVKQGTRSLAGVLGKLGTKTRETLFSSTSAKVLAGPVAFSGLSAVADYVLADSISRFAVETAESAAEAAFNREFTPQQRRALRMAGRMAVQEYRNSRQSETPPSEVDNSGLSEGAKADVSQQEEREAA